MSKLMIGNVVHATDKSPEALLNAKRKVANALAEAILKESEVYEDIFIVKETATGLTVGTKILFPHVDVEEEDSLAALKTVLEGIKE